MPASRLGTAASSRGSGLFFVARAGRPRPGAQVPAALHLSDHPLTQAFAAFDLPDGRIDKVYLHWSAGPYDRPSSAYHFVVGFRTGLLFAEQTHDVRENMRQVTPDVAYAAHTRGRNSYAIGVSALSMLDATPHDFGPAPLTPELLDALLAMTAFICRRYGITVHPQNVLTHAECAVVENYFGLLPQQRWDLSRLDPAAEPLTEAEALDTGEALRRRISAYLR
ncbi:MAG: N-acetylmuramoyl-L-alanine amidase [Candidatus Eremiobacteraeota bacterium]|nr:N-acetylmuramoyl-L-alanine amidase [Candidatus Eremiobacteraeota bacterium]